MVSFVAQDVAQARAFRLDLPLAEGDAVTCVRSFDTYDTLDITDEVFWEAGHVSPRYAEQTRRLRPISFDVVDNPAPCTLGVIPRYSDDRSVLGPRLLISRTDRD